MHNGPDESNQNFIETFRGKAKSCMLHIGLASNCVVKLNENTTTRSTLYDDLYDICIVRLSQLAIITQRDAAFLGYLLA